MNDWITKLSTVSEIVEMWLIVQNMYVYMEAVFSGGDIVKQLPAEAKRFNNIDKQFMRVVGNAGDIKNVVEVCYENDQMQQTLPYLTEQLELCQKSLTAFLDTKRAQFPRFYFVSDPTLLEILSLGSDPPSVTPHFPVRSLRLPHRGDLRPTGQDQDARDVLAAEGVRQVCEGERRRP